jgi:predicted nucleotidyltransferase
LRRPAARARVGGRRLPKALFGILSLFPVGLAVGAQKQISREALEAALAGSARSTPQLAAARAFVEDLQAQDKSVIGAFVHGSAARGDSLDDSDVDLHVVVEGDPPAPAAFWRDDVVLDVMYLSTDMMTVDPRDFLDSEEGREELARGHLVWDIVDSIVIFDPDGLVRGYKRIAATLSRDPELLKLRAGFILEDSVGTLGEARDAFARDPLEGFTHLYRAPGPAVRGGAAPIAMQSLVAMGSRPLGFRSLFPQFRVAAEDFGYLELVGYAQAAWGLSNVSVARADAAFELMTRIYDSGVKAVEAARAEGLEEAATSSEPYMSATERDRAVALAKSLVDSGEVHGAIAFAVGKSLQVLALDEFPNPWLKADRGRPEEVIRKGIEKILGSPDTEDTSARMDALDTIQWTLAELLSG